MTSSARTYSTSFPTKLFHILQRKSSPDKQEDEAQEERGMFWSEDGKYVYFIAKVFNENESKLYFQGTPYNSFCRRMYRHGFDRILEEGNHQHPAGVHVFRHPCFQRGHEEWLEGIRMDNKRLYRRAVRDNDTPTGCTDKNAASYTRSPHKLKPSVLPGKSISPPETGRSHFDTSTSETTLLLMGTKSTPTFPVSTSVSPNDCSFSTIPTLCLVGKNAASPPPERGEANQLCRQLGAVRDLAVVQNQAHLGSTVPVSLLEANDGSPSSSAFLKPGCYDQNLVPLARTAAGTNWPETASLPSPSTVALQSEPTTTSIQVQAYQYKAAEQLLQNRIVEETRKLQLATQQLQQRNLLLCLQHRLSVGQQEEDEEQRKRHFSASPNKTKNEWWQEE